MADDSPGLLLPTSPSHSTYAGYVRVPGLSPGGDGDAWVRLEGVKADTRGHGSGQLLRHARLALGPDLEGVLQPHAATLAARLRDAPSVPAFLAELRALAGRAVQADGGDDTSPSTLPPPALTAAASAAVEAAGAPAWAALASASPCGTRLGFEAVDDAGRTHTLTVRFEPDFLAGRPPRTAAALPGGPLSVDWRAAAAASTPPLAAALDAWRAALAVHADFWACADGLDARFRVLDPAPPGPGDTHRVLALRGGASAEIELDPSRPRCLPPAGLAFMGAPAATASPQAAWEGFVRGGRWDARASPADNLAAACGEWLLPSAAASAAAAAATAAPAAMADEPTGAECAICYAYHLPVGEGGGGGGDGAPAAATPPSVHCPHPTCGRPYHASCLRGWLASLPGARAALGQLSGACPYCGQDVAVPVGVGD